ncbi:adenylylsulfate kinase [Striga asiatica]|uniref:Adenylylsulfate kinase n=1 Tax=Striga asiatica TaxID=4170 RepID=A0A5A7P7J1_STRAF|nr:adenylylsulfate kinase [Striga asiatica]
MDDFPFAVPTTKEEHFNYMRDGMLERWDEWLAIAFCRILRRFVVLERMTEEGEIFVNFYPIHMSFVEETGSCYTLKNTYRMYKVLMERFKTFQWLLDQSGVYHDPFDFTIHVPFLVKKLALKYVLNVPEPRWDYLKPYSNHWGHWRSTQAKSLTRHLETSHLCAIYSGNT